MQKAINLYFPQYQGSGPDNAIAIGAETLFEHFSKTLNFTKINCSKNTSAINKNIFSYDVILENFLEAKNIIEKHNPEKIFLLGGDCSTELSAVSWLNQKYQGDLLVIWFDAHGDLNTPESSLSHNLNGMPLRTLLGDGDQTIVANLFSILKIEQVILAGARDLDKAEVDFIQETKLNYLPVENLKVNLMEMTQRMKNKFSNIYIHCDLDVIDPNDVPYVKSVTANGIKLADLIELINSLNKEFNVVGQSLTEYTGREFISDINNLIAK